ncbi:MAG: hypothetical protein LJF30_12980 [Acidobacteria bacterium]|nr:hypothetical protein [Acidobacteriota bacterium]
MLLKTTTFDSSPESSEARILLTDVARLPADWSGYEALVIELRASSSQRMNLKVYTAGEDSGSGEPLYSRVLFHPYPNVWVRAAIPVALLAEAPSTGNDMAAVGNRSRNGYFLSLWGPFVPLTNVEAIAFEMDHPVGSPTLEIRSVELAETSPGDAVLDGLPVVDRFGQSTHDAWPDKAESLEDLEQAWKRDEETLAPGDLGYCRYGGYENTRAGKTGFFRVEKVDGRWWFVDPDGHLFLSAGCDVMRPAMVTPARGRDGFFEELPPAGLLDGLTRDADRGASFLTWNLSRRFGEGWKNRWVDMTFQRMEAWGLNTVANWSDPALYDAKRKPYAIPLARWESEVSYLGLPDVYSDEFTRRVDERAKEQCAPRKDDPWLLGYFLANEPPFPQKELQTVDLILAGPDSATKAALQKWLADGDTEERRKEFIGEAFDRYIQITSAAVKRHDPNHLNLGMRSGGRPTAAEIRAARAFDVYSVNVYDYEVPAERVKQISELTGKPIVIGEFHFGTPGRGLAASLVLVRDQAERGRAYRYYVEQAFAQPELIGTHYFQWADQPCTGRFDGENYNIGLVDVTDRPYPHMVEALQETHGRLHRVHAGEEEPFAEKARVN